MAELNVIYDQYAQYYDLLYRDKDYTGEAAFVHGQLTRDVSAGGRMLELGCGTGRHALEFARLGWQMKGLDLSPEMVAAAKRRAAEVPADLGRRLSFAVGDMRQVRDDQPSDVVASLFHVIGYQTSNRDLQAAVATAAANLRPGGCYFFDFWFGGAVLSDPPVVRVKRLENEAITVTRLAEPELRPAENVVVVRYEVLVEDRKTGAVSRFTEAHRVRYLFLPELEALLDAQGFDLLRTGKWLSDEPLDKTSWFGWLIARRR